MQLEKFLQLPTVKREAMLFAGMKEFSEKSYNDANTDRIVKECGISKGLLFHYFGSKKDFYLYCLDCALNQLIRPTEIAGESFYEVLFASMKAKMEICTKYAAETAFVNMASRESANAVTAEKKELFKRYAMQTNAESMQIVTIAISKLTIKEEYKDSAIKGLMLYSSAIINQYLIRYQTTPNVFFENAEQIQAEMKEYIDMLLYGIIKQAN